MGLMLHEEPPIGWMKDNPKLREREEREVSELGSTLGKDPVADRIVLNMLRWGKNS